MSTVSFLRNIPNHLRSKPHIYKEGRWWVVEAANRDAVVRGVEQSVQYKNIKAFSWAFHSNSVGCGVNK